MTSVFLLIAGINGLLAVALGAFAAHGLKSILEVELLATFQTGVQYQITHALAILAIALLSLHAPGNTLLKVSGYLFTFGILFFSGSLYILSLTGIRWLGAITPVGGICFLAAWACLCWFAISTEFPR